MNKFIKFTFILSLILLSLVFSLYLFSPEIFADVGNGASHSTSHTSSSNSSGGNTFFLIYLFIHHPYIFVICAIIYFIYKKYFKNKSIINNDTAPVYQNSTPTTVNNNAVAELKAKDPNFSERAFISKANNMYMQLQDAWMNKTWKTIRPFETDELFNTHSRQLQNFINNKTTNVVENICILSSQIINFENDGVNDILDIEFKIRMNDYVINENRQIVEGDPKQEIYMTYVWTFIRKQGVLTDVQKSQLKATQCPNCGANVSINASGECDYCNSTISSGQYDWVLSAIKVVNQH